MKRFREALAGVNRERRKVDRIHTVCMLCIIQYLLILGASVLVTSAAVTTLIFMRDAHMALLGDE